MDTLPLVPVCVAPRTAARVAEVSRICALPTSQLIEQALDIWVQHNMSVTRPRRSFDIHGNESQQRWKSPISQKRTIWNSSYIPENMLHSITSTQAMVQAELSPANDSKEYIKQQFGISQLCPEVVDADAVDTIDPMDLEDDLQSVKCAESGWESLPNTVAQQLFGSLTRKSAATARLVCSSWSESVFQNTTSLALDWPIQNLGMCNLGKLPQLGQLSLSCRSDWANPHLQPVLDLLSQTDSIQTSLDLSPTLWHLGHQHIAMLGALTGLTGLSINNTFPPAMSLPSLATLTGLTSLSVSCCGMEPQALPVLMSVLPQLTELDWSGNLFHAPLPRGHLEAKALQKLRLTNCDVGDDALQFFSRVTSLRSLDLSILPYFPRPRRLRSDVFLSNVGVGHLAGLTSLTELRLQNQMQVTSEGIRQLQSLSCLAALDLAGCMSLLDDGDLQGVGALTSLRELSLQAVNNNIVAPTPVGFLTPLSTLRSLRSLDLSDNWERVSLEGLARLAELPRLTSLDVRAGNEGHVLQSTSGGVYKLEELEALLNRTAPLLSLMRADGKGPHLAVTFA